MRAHSWLFSRPTTSAGITSAGITSAGIKVTCLATCLAASLLADQCRAKVPTEPPTFSNPLQIDNKFAPIQVGGIKVYRGTMEGQRLVVTELHLADTRSFSWTGGSAEARVVKELGFVDGVLDEVSWEFFAQADDGTVYQFGEVLDQYQDGVIVDHEGSWLVGGPQERSDPPGTANAPRPTILMPAVPEVGDEFKPEDLYPIVDETVLVLDINKRTQVPAGKFKGLLKLKETSAMPDSVPERKWVAAGVGVVRVRSTEESLVLISTNFEAAEQR